MEKKEIRKAKRKQIFKKIGSVAMSVGLGVIKATPFGHVATEIENNMNNPIGGKKKIDCIRMIVWILVTLTFIAKFFNLITFEDLEKMVDIIFQINSTN